MALVLTKLVRSNYDELDNIPIIRQDLTTSFTKEANTYYIHTGSTTSAYTKGRMYYCDGTNLKKVVIVDEVNDGKLTITVNGTAHTFTANQSGNTSFSITDTTYTAGTGLSLLNGVFSVKTGYSTNGKNYKVATDTNGNLYVNVPWTDTNTDTHYTNYLQIKGNGTEAVKFTQNADKTLNFKPGNNVSISAAANEITISATDTNTSHSHSAGVGLVGSGSAGTGSGTYSYKAKLRSETALIEDSIAVATVSGRVYPVAVDKSGYLSVNVPWNNTNTATAADNILDGSNNGTQITYKPYTSQQSKLSFDTSTTNPTRTDRLNLNGYLYATKLYSNGKEVLTSHQSIKSINTNNTAAQTVNASEAITGSGTINLHKVSKTGNYNDLLNKPTIPDISGKLDKTTYEWNKEFAAGSNGAISLGRYNIYDTQLTFDISSTTSISMNGKLVIATQNGRICQAKVFGDATGVLVSKIVIYQSAIVDNRSWIEIFCNFDGWSKNKVHIYGVALNSATVTKQMSSVTFTNGVPSPITNGDSKWSGTIDNDSPIFNYNSSTKTLTISF